MLDGETILINCGCAMPPSLQTLVVAHINDEELLVKRLYKWEYLPVPRLLKGGFGRRQVLFQLLEGGNIPRAGLGFLDGAAQAVKLLYAAAQHHVK